MVALAGVRAWLVGGAVRDRLLDRETTDFDVVVAGDPAQLARAVGRDAGGHAFELSDAFGAWRVVAHDRSWQLDVLGLGDATLEQDLGRRDLTVNAIAQPLGTDDGEPVDPFGGLADLSARRLRMVSEHAFRDDPLRTLRLARLACQLDFDAEAATVRRARESADGLAGVAPERAFAELRALVCSDRALQGLELMDRLGATAALLPELDALHGVAQSRFHHLDVSDHTRAVLGETIALVADPERLAPDPAVREALTAALAQPLANELTRAQALRFGALLHDIAKPQTRGVTEQGRVTFMGHDAAGARLASEILGRLRASERLRGHVAALCEQHLRLGFLVHRTPLSRRDVFGYLDACAAPRSGHAAVGLDVTVLSVADRLATGGDDAQRAIARHLELARSMIVDALAWEADPPRAPVRGDELARALRIAPGPRLGELLAQLRAEAFADGLTDPGRAIARARELAAG